MKESQRMVSVLAARRRLIKNDFYEFLRYFWDVSISTPFKSNFHIEYLCDRLQSCVYDREVNQKRTDLLINVPPSSSKTTICQVMFPNWLWLQNPQLRILAVSYADKAILKPAMDCRQILMSEKWQRLFDVKIGQTLSGIKFYQNNYGGLRFATTVGGTLTSLHFDYILFDDPIKPSEAQSKLHLEKCIEFRTQTLSNRETIPGLSPLILLMQRLHHDDLAGFELRRNNEHLEHVCLPAELTDDVRPIELKEKYVDGLLSPSRLPLSKLKEEKELKGTQYYASQYLQVPSNDETSLFKLSNNRYCNINNGVIEANDKFIELRSCYRFFTVDLALTTKETSDYTVVLYCATDKESNIYVIDCLRVKVKGAEHKRIITEMYQKHKPQRIAIESVQYQATLVQELDDKGLPVEKITPDKDKRSRAIPASARHEAGKIYFNTALPNLGELETELNQFPAASHDDFVDALAYAVDHTIKHNNTITLINPKSYSKKRERKSWD